MGSVNWASGLITLGRLYLRPLKRHFHSLGLTNWFTQPCQSDPLVLATLLRQWQDLSFLMSGIPIQPFQAEFTILTDASTQGWGSRMGDSQIVAYINKQVGTHSQAGSRSVSLLQTQDIALRARHILGCLNVIADWLSRPNQPITTEWSLHPEEIFRL